jgi:hypothetical protein
MGEDKDDSGPPYPQLVLLHLRTDTMYNNYFSDSTMRTERKHQNRPFVDIGVLEVEN